MITEKKFLCIIKIKKDHFEVKSVKSHSLSFFFRFCYGHVRFCTATVESATAGHFSVTQIRGSGNLRFRPKMGVNRLRPLF